ILIFWARLQFNRASRENISADISYLINFLPRLYPSLPGVEGAQGISAGGPKGRLAACTKKIVCVDQF
ncbi:MAG: hypothetical protein WA127_09980, partial [Methanothrix sp.]